MHHCKINILYVILFLSVFLFCILIVLSFFFSPRYLKLNLKHEEREEIGIQCKRLIDMGRMDYLQKHGYQVELVSYIDKSISLENVALIGFYKES